MRRKLVHHGSVRLAKIYDGSIRHPRVGVDDNKSVGLKVSWESALSLGGTIATYLVWNAWRKLRGREDVDLLITAYKYNKGPSGHVTTLTSSVKD
jgi:hypothetical protein